MNSDVASLPIVRVYIDETGDRGFGPKASPYFGLAALLAPEEADAELRSVVQQMRADFHIDAGRPLHWVEHCRPRHHSRRKYAARLLSGLDGIQVIYCLLDKSGVPQGAGMRSSYQKSYNFMSRLLFERVSWCARDWPGGRRRAITKVARVKGVDHSDTLRYISNICPRIDPGNAWELVSKIQVEGTASYDGLQAADLYCGMFHAALTKDPFGATSHEYLMTCKRQLYRGPRGRILRYGMKVLGDDGLITGQSWWPELAS